jgi:hypothetical protein
LTVAQIVNIIFAFFWIQRNHYNVHKRPTGHIRVFLQRVY